MENEQLQKPGRNLFSQLSEVISKAESIHKYQFYA